MSPLQALWLETARRVALEEDKPVEKKEVQHDEDEPISQEND